MNTNEFREKTKNRAILLINCPDRPGIVARISTMLYQLGANIIDSNQHSTDPFGGHFFLRVEFECIDLAQQKNSLEQELRELSQELALDYSINYESDMTNIALFVSKDSHCLHEILHEWQRGDLKADIKLVISNHEDLRSIVENEGIDFYYTPISKDTKPQVEASQLELLEKYEVNTIVLARYMQILSPKFIQHYPTQIINIHHSFLPAFIGANPYKRAYDRGVKLIGATAHYVTEDLDEGPIIEQDIERVKHFHEVADLKKIGSEVERKVLLRALRWHVNHRVIPFGNKTIVFEN